MCRQGFRKAIACVFARIIPNFGRFVAWSQFLDEVLGYRGGQGCYYNFIAVQVVAMICKCAGRVKLCDNLHPEQLFPHCC